MKKYIFRYFMCKFYFVAGKSMKKNSRTAEYVY